MKQMGVAGPSPIKAFAATHCKLQLTRAN